MTSRRWDGDSRGAGVGSGEAFAPHLRQMAERMADGGWLAEDPEEHLLPHIRRACDDSQGLWSLMGARLEDGVYIVNLRWTGDLARRARVRSEAMGLIGSFAEVETHVRERPAEGLAVFEVATGLPGEGGFVPHGHLLRLLIEGQAAGG